MTKNFVAFDVETANPRYGSICSFGVVVVERGRVVDRVTQIVQPPASLNYFEGRNMGIHGITPSMVASKRSLLQLWPELVGLLEDRLVICHNASFDINALRQAADALRRRKPRAEYFCTMKASRAYLGLRSATLPVVTDELGIGLPRHHNALCDAEAAASIALELMKRFRATSVAELAARTGQTIQRI